MSTPPEGYLKVGTVNGLMVRPRSITTNEGQAIAAFYHNGQVYAVANRCPHSGYPLETGSVREGILTCAWHQARFDIASGTSMDPLIEDIDTFPVTVIEGEVWVDPVPSPSSEATSGPS